MIVGSTDQKFTVDVMKDISSAQSAEIKFIKPDNTNGYFSATIVDDVNGIIEYAVQNVSDIDMAGDWIFWAKISYTDGSVGYGEPFVVTAKNQGQL
jgi:hypothetical protein